MPSSAASSWNPYWVGTKNGLVVTWLTNQNCHAGVFGKLPAVLFAVLALLLGELRGRRGRRTDQAGAGQQLPAAGSVLHVQRLDRLIDLGVDFSLHGPPFPWGRDVSHGCRAGNMPWVVVRANRAGAPSS